MSRLKFDNTYHQRKLAGISLPAATCKFIAGDRPYGPNPYCDKPTVDDTSYCQQHRKICFKEFDAAAAKGFEKWAAK